MIMFGFSSTSPTPFRKLIPFVRYFCALLDPLPLAPLMPGRHMWKPPLVYENLSFSLPPYPIRIKK